MPTTTLTSKGRITIPQEVRRKLNLKPGDRVRLLFEADRLVRLLPVTRDLAELRGILPRPPRAVSLADQDAALRRHAARHA